MPADRCYDLFSCFAYSQNTILVPIKDRLNQGIMTPSEILKLSLADHLSKRQRLQL